MLAEKQVAIRRVIEALWRILETTEVRQGLGADGVQQVARLLEEAEADLDTAVE